MKRMRKRLLKEHLSMHEEIKLTKFIDASLNEDYLASVNMRYVRRIKNSLIVSSSFLVRDFRYIV